MRTLRSAAKDVAELVRIVWTLPLVILVLVLPLAALEAVIRVVLHAR